MILLYFVLMHEPNIQKSIAMVKTKIKLDSHIERCVVGNQCLILNDHNRPVNIFRYYPKAGSKHACIVDAAIVYDEPEMVQAVTFSIHQTI